MKNFALCLCLLLGSTFAALAQAPTDNPYQTKYNPDIHWTNDILWSNTVDATAGANGLSTVSSDSVANTTNLNNLIATTSTTGGGVIFIPAGTYYFADSIELQSNVVLRGPASIQDSATSADFAPPARLVFPIMMDTAAAITGNGLDRTKYFKRIKAASRAENTGLVNLDINGAVIMVFPQEAYADSTNAAGTQTRIPRDYNQNVIMMGIRQNHAVLPDPYIPRQDHENWQRMGWRFTPNIGLYVSENAVVANCRLNDYENNNVHPIVHMQYRQPGYKANNESDATKSCSSIPADGSGSIFKYTDHYGVIINKTKITNVGGAYATPIYESYNLWGAIKTAEPDEEPDYYAKGVEVLDNWVFATQRVKLHVGGLGMIVKNNELHDLPRSQKDRFVNPTGQDCKATPGQTTFEDRGIDWAGWDVELSNNFIETYPTNVNAAGPSNAGEGILLQNDAGTTVNGFLVDNNVLSGENSYIGVYKTYDVNNVNITNNRFENLGCKGAAPVLILAENGGTNTINNVVVSNNTGIDIPSGCTGLAKIAISSANNPQTGSNVVVASNSGNGTIAAPCFATLSNNIGLTPNSSPPLCLGSNYIAGNFIMNADTTIQTSASSVSYTATIKVRTDGITSAATADFILDRTIELSNVFVSGTDSTVSYTFNNLMPGNDYYISARLKQGNNRLGYVEPVKISVRVATGLKPAMKGKSMLASVFPNPTEDGRFTVRLDNNQNQAMLRVTDLQGRVVMTTVANNNQDTQLNMSRYAKGIYLLEISQKDQHQTIKLVK